MISCIRNFIRLSKLENIPRERIKETKYEFY